MRYIWEFTLHILIFTKNIHNFGICWHRYFGGGNSFLGHKTIFVRTRVL